VILLAQHVQVPYHNAQPVQDPYSFKKINVILIAVMDTMEIHPQIPVMSVIRPVLLAMVHLQLIV